VLDDYIALFFLNFLFLFCTVQMLQFFVNPCKPQSGFHWLARKNITIYQLLTI